MLLCIQGEPGREVFSVVVHKRSNSLSSKLENKDKYLKPQNQEIKNMLSVNKETNSVITGQVLLKIVASEFYNNPYGII